MDGFLITIAEILEVDEVQMSDSLSSFDAWDSLVILSIIAFCSDHYSVSLTADEIAGSETINGLKELIESKQ